MEEIIREINSNFDLFDFLLLKYDENKIRNTELKYDSSYIKAFRNQINWKEVSTSAPLSEVEIDLYFEELRECKIIHQSGPAHGCKFSENTNIKWTETILDKYKNYLDWVSICKNPSVPWNEKLIDKYLFSKINSTSNWIALSSNPSIKWNEYLLKRYFPHLFLNCIIKYSKITWSKPLLRCALELTSKENQKLYLTYFSEIINIEWDLDLLIAFPISYSYWVNNIIKNKTIKLSFSELRNKINYIEKDLFQILQLSEELIWNCDLVSEFSDHINFKILSASNNVDWSSGLIELFQKDLDFKTLSSNTHIIINEDLITKYKVKWDFELLSANYTAKWTINLIEDNIDKIELIKILEYSELDFTPEFIDKYRTRIKWEGHLQKFGSDSYRYEASTISQLSKIPIAVETLKKMSSKWEKGCELVRVGTKDEERDIGEWHFYSNNWNLTYEHLEIFENELSWNVLSSNRNLKINEEILLKYPSRWDYSEIMKREDINWNVKLFSKISRFLNWDILNGYEDKVMGILKPAENLILNHFAYGNQFWGTIHSDNWHTSFHLKEYSVLFSDLEEKLYEYSLMELKAVNLNEVNQLWRWLSKYSSLFYKSSRLTKALKREVISNKHIISEFFNKYEGAMNRYKKEYYAKGQI